MKKYVLVLVCLMVCSSLNANLLVDPGFEDVALTGYWQPSTFTSADWNRFTWGGNVTNAWVTDGGGNNDFDYAVYPGGLEINPSDQAMKVRWASTGVQQVVEGIVAGTDYDFSVDGYHSSQNPSKVDLSLRVAWEDATGAWIANPTGGNTWTIAEYRPSVESLDVWTTIGGSMTAPTGAVAVRYILLADNSAGDGNGGFTYFDDAVVDGQIVPEPATLAMLGLGAISLFRRRNKK